MPLTHGEAFAVAMAVAAAEVAVLADWEAANALLNASTALLYMFAANAGSCVTHRIIHVTNASSRSEKVLLSFRCGAEPEN